MKRCQSAQTSISPQISANLCLKKLMWGGGSKTVWNLSENSSVLKRTTEFFLLHHPWNHTVMNFKPASSNIQSQGLSGKAPRESFMDKIRILLIDFYHVLLSLYIVYHFIMSSFVKIQLKFKFSKKIHLSKIGKYTTAVPMAHVLLISTFTFAELFCKIRKLGSSVVQFTNWLETQMWGIRSELCIKRRIPFVCFGGFYWCWLDFCRSRNCCSIEACGNKRYKYCRHQDYHSSLSNVQDSLLWWLICFTDLRQSSCPRALSWQSWWRDSWIRWQRGRGWWGRTQWGDHQDWWSSSGRIIGWLVALPNLLRLKTFWSSCVNDERED